MAALAGEVGMFTRRQFLGGAVSFLGPPIANAWSSPEEQSKVASLHAEAFGMTADKADVGPALSRAVAALTRIRGGRLVLPPGEFHVGSRSGAAVEFRDLPMVQIEGSGTALTFEGLCRPFDFYNCRNVFVSGLSIDWLRPPFSQGDIVSVSADGRVVDLDLDAMTPMDGWTKVEAIGGYDRDTGRLSRKRIDAYGGVDGVETLSGRKVRLRLTRALNLAANQTLVLRHAVYEAHGFVFSKCGSVAVDRVTVNSTPGMAFVFGHCGDVSISRCVVAPPTDSTRLMSTTADAAHLADCTGKLRLEDCHFARMGDDGINVHKTYWRISRLANAHTLVATKRQNARFANTDAPAAGARFRLVSGSTLETIGEAEVEQANPASPSDETLSFRRPIPAGVEVGDFIIPSNGDSLAIVNCKFVANRARGVLAHDNACIRGCEFRDQSMQGLVLSPDLWWYEGPAVENVRIIDNVFDGVDRWRLNQGAILVDAIVTDAEGRSHTTSGRPNRNIRLERNAFKDCPTPNVLVRGVG